MLHNHLLQCIAVAVGLVIAFYCHMTWGAKKLDERQLHKKKKAKVVPLPDEYQTMWNIPEWKKGGYEEASKKLWEKIKKEEQSAANN